MCHIYVYMTHVLTLLFILWVKHFCVLIASGRIERAGDSREEDLQRLQFSNIVFRRLSTKDNLP